MSFYFEEPPIGVSSTEFADLRIKNEALNADSHIDASELEEELNESQSLKTADMNNDTADAESGVEPDSNEWIFQDIGESVEFDITAEQAMATLRYFTSTAERANFLTKTHHDDLEVISSLLQEKEKDLEMAARIGQSLLQRNKNLLLKIEAMEDYISNVSEQENQMKHEVALKNDLIRNILREEDSFNFEFDSMKSDSISGKSFNDSGCKDESILLLENKCKQLEQHNVELLNEALNLKDMANQAEEEEQDLVVDCVKHLALAKEQITHLTDEIALKFEDNVAQQEEITELISMVVELQRKHKQLSVENEELQYQLDESQQSQESLRSQLIDMQRRFQECAELLRENQDEVKTLRGRVESTEHSPWALENSPTTTTTQHDSLAMEIEETLKRELTSHERNREKTSRVLEQVRNANRYLKPSSNYTASNSGNCSSAASLKSQTSVDSDDHSISSLSRSFTGSQDLDDSRRRRGFLAAEKLQIVKPMEGSLTLHKWHHLASENVVAGLNVGNVLTHRDTNKDSGLPISPDDTDPMDSSSTISHSEFASYSKFQDSGNGIFEGNDDDSDDDNDDDFGLTLKADRSSKKEKVQASHPDVKAKQSTPVQVNSKSMESMFGSGHEMQDSMARSTGLKGLGLESSLHQDRSIITRNSSILASMREARSMLNRDNSSAKSKASAIDILANAMNKANIEAKTGQRILESVSNRNTQERSTLSTPRKDYQDMPKLNKVLERLASNKDKGKVDLDAVRTPLRILVEKAASASTAKANVPFMSGATTLEQANKDEEKARPAAVLPSLMAGAAGMRATTGVLSNLLQKGAANPSQAPLLSTVLSSNISVVHSNTTNAKPALTRSWSSGDIKGLNKENLSTLGSFDTDSNAEVVGRIRRNSINVDGTVSLPNTKNSVFQGLGMLKRSNSSGSLSDLVKQSEIKATAGSPPKSVPFISFDNYGVEDYSLSFGSSSSSTVTTTVTTTSATTSSTTTASKPAGFLRSLFLRSATENSNVDVKRPSSLHEGGAASLGAGAGKGSAASVESGINRFGKALAQDDFGGFGFGFMSYFSGGSKKPGSSSS